MIKSTVVGNYPKLPYEKGNVNIRRMLHKFDKGKISAEELDQVFYDVTERVINEQNQAGIDLATDGQIRWHDLVTPLAAKIPGFEIGGLLRWFDNNVYYRRPQIVSELKWQQPILAEWYQYAAEKSNSPIKVVLPSPFSFAMLCDDHYYKNFDKLLQSLTEILHSEAEALLKAGAKQIQFDDPSLQYFPDHLESSAASLNKVIDNLNGEFWLCFYFGSVSEILGKIDLFNVDVIAVDCVSKDENFESLLNMESDKNACFGLLESRNIKLEQEADLISKYEKIAKRFPNSYISPATGLEFLPHRDALAKINLLGKSVSKFNNGGGNA